MVVLLLQGGDRLPGQHSDLYHLWHHYCWESVLWSSSQQPLCPDRHRLWLGCSPMAAAAGKHPSWSLLLGCPLFLFLFSCAPLLLTGLLRRLAGLSAPCWMLPNLINEQDNCRRSFEHSRHSVKWNSCFADWLMTVQMTLPIVIDLLTAVQVVRIINVALFWPVLIRTSPRIDLPSAAATAWSGIRGFVGIILALMVSVDPNISDEPYKLLCFFFMATTACLTIVLQGGTFELLLWVS